MESENVLARISPARENDRMGETLIQLLTWNFDGDHFDR